MKLCGLETLLQVGCLCGLLLTHPLKPASADEFKFYHEHVLGTSLELTVQSDSTEQAHEVEQTVLGEIDRLAKLLSSHDPDSELMRWQAGQRLDTELSRDLRNVLSRASHWRHQTGGVFEVRSAALTSLWKSAAIKQQLPTSESIRAIVAQLKEPGYTVSDSGITHLDRMPISLDALAKGYILDGACATASATHHIDGLMLMIGGDLRKLGSSVQTIAIHDPHRPDLNSSPKVSFQLKRPLGMATSGGYRRFVEINGQRYSHIIDPRTGQPANTIASVTVLAPTAMDADALATSISVLGMREGLVLVDQLEGTACLIISNSGDVVTSHRWAELTEPVAGKLITTQQSGSTKKDEKPEDKPKDGLMVSFTLKQTGGGRYRRPYVAVWLEDKDGYPVKTAVLWLQTTGPGPRWHRDLTRWYSDDRMRKLNEETDLIGTISGATRGPGQYEARFDGTDNAGVVLKPGKYTLCLEAAREHGTHQLIREEVEIGDKALPKKELKGGDEISAASYSYKPVVTSSK